jgi:hypothetical protein
MAKEISISQPEMDRKEHDDALTPPTKRVLMYGFDGAAKEPLSLNSNGEINISPISSLYGGTKTVPTGTAEAIASSQAIYSVTIKALLTNTVAVYVGPSGVTTSSGFELLAGESVSIEVSNLNLVYCISGSASQVIRYIAC